MNEESNLTTPPAPVVPDAVAAQPPVMPPEPAVSPQPLQPIAKDDKQHRIIDIALVLAIIILATGCGLLYSDHAKLQSRVSSLSAANKSLESNPQIVAQKQTADTIKSVSALMTLPTGETPTVANVNDASQARKQSAFFAAAQNDDKVLMYVKAGEAILYRPATNKIILVAPLTFNSAATAKQ